MGPPASPGSKPAVKRVRKTKKVGISISLQILNHFFCVQAKLAGGADPGAVQGPGQGVAFSVLPHPSSLPPSLLSISAPLPPSPTHPTLSPPPLPIRVPALLPSPTPRVIQYTGTRPPTPPQPVRQCRSITPAHQPPIEQSQVADSPAYTTDRDSETNNAAVILTTHSHNPTTPTWTVAVSRPVSSTTRPALGSLAVRPARPALSPALTSPAVSPAPSPKTSPEKMVILMGGQSQVATKGGLVLSPPRPAPALRPETGEPQPAPAPPTAAGQQQ